MLPKHRIFSTTNASINYACTMCVCVCQCLALCHWYGKLRRTDFLPIGPDRKDEVFERGCDSVDSDSEDAAEIAYSYGMNRAFMPVSDSEQSESERPHCIGNDLIDFLPYEDSVAADA